MEQNVVQCWQPKRRRRYFGWTKQKFPGPSGRCIPVRWAARQDCICGFGFADVWLVVEYGRKLAIEDVYGKTQPFTFFHINPIAPCFVEPLASVSQGAATGLLVLCPTVQQSTTSASDYKKATVALSSFVGSFLSAPHTTNTEKKQSKDVVNISKLEGKLVMYNGMICWYTYEFDIKLSFMHESKPCAFQTSKTEASTIRCGMT